MRARMGGHWWSYENQRVNMNYRWAALKKRLFLMKKT